MMTNKKYKNILIVEVNWLGDVIFSTPFIRTIHEKFKDAKITCLLDERVKGALIHNPYIDDIIVYNEKSTHKGFLAKAKLISYLRKKHFDIAFILHRSFTKALIVFLSGIQERVGYDTKNRSFLLTKAVEVPEKPLHKVEYFLKIAETFGCMPSRKKYDFFVSKRDRENILRKLEESGIEKDDILIVLNPGGNWLPKQWAEEGFAEVGDILSEKYKAKIIISGSGKDMDKAKRIKSIMKHNAIIFSGKTSLGELGALMERANFVISGDSGPMHIAVALGSNVIAIFGPTSPELTGPYGEGNYSIVQKESDCEIPCYDLTCNNYKCMKDIRPSDVIQVFDEMYRHENNQ
jgi:lipopolysaccharide heptosyltransferase II